MECSSVNSCTCFLFDTVASKALQSCKPSVCSLPPSHWPLRQSQFSKVFHSPLWCSTCLQRTSASCYHLLLTSNPSLKPSFYVNGWAQSPGSVIAHPLTKPKQQHITSLFTPSCFPYHFLLLPFSLLVFMLKTLQGRCPIPFYFTKHIQNFRLQKQ